MSYYDPPEPTDAEVYAAREAEAEAEAQELADMNGADAAVLEAEATDRAYAHFEMMCLERGLHPDREAGGRLWQECMAEEGVA